MNETGSVELKQEEITERKTKKTWFRPTLFGLIALILIACLALINVFGYYNDFQSCRQLAETAKAESLPTQIIDCDLSFGERLVYFFTSRSVSVSAEENLEQARIEMSKQIAAEKVKQDELKVQLENLLVDYDEEIIFSSVLLGLEELERQVETTKALRQLLAENESKPSEEINQIQGFLDQFSELNLAQNQAQLNSYKNFSKDEQIERFSEIKTFGESVQKQIEKKYFANYPQSNASRADLLNFKFYQPQDFKNTFDQKKTDYTNTVKANPNVNITGNADVDNYVFALGESRGYERTAQAEESNLIGVGQERLQPQAWEAWEEMKAAAKNEGVDLGLVSGYRSVGLQRDLFWNRFNSYSQSQYGVNYSSADILAGRADLVLDELMQGTAPPGYSRHHTGYTIDIRDNGQPNFLQFKETPGYAWISANNYFNAKRFGFLPSYPVGLDNMGPNPEAWEYVWVGVSR